MRSLLAVLLIVAPAIVFAAKGEKAAGGATPEEALKRLQNGAKARDLVEMTAALERDNRGLLLRDFYAVAVSLYSVELEAAPSRPKHERALQEVFDRMIAPALDANPIDPSVLQGHDEDARAMIVLGWGISRLSARDAVEVARVISAALADASHPVPGQILDAYIEQVPAGPVTIDRRTEDAVWAHADGRPLGFTREDGRWYAGGVWYTKQTFKIGGE